MPKPGRKPGFVISARASTCPPEGFPALQDRDPAYVWPIMSSLVLALGLGSTELLLIFAVILLLFGGAKLPSLARGLGQSIKEFKKASRDEEEKPATEAKKVETTNTTSTTK